MIDDITARFASTKMSSMLIMRVNTVPPCHRAITNFDFVLKKVDF